MAANKDEILDAISKMTVLEVVELISDMEKKFGVTGRRSGRVRCRLRLRLAVLLPLLRPRSRPSSPSL